MHLFKLVYQPDQRQLDKKVEWRQNISSPKGG